MIYKCHKLICRISNWVLRSALNKTSTMCSCKRRDPQWFSKPGRWVILFKNHPSLSLLNDRTMKINFPSLKCFEWVVRTAKENGWLLSQFNHLTRVSMWFLICYLINNNEKKHMHVISLMHYKKNCGRLQLLLTFWTSLDSLLEWAKVKFFLTSRIRRWKEEETRKRKEESWSFWMNKHCESGILYSYDWIILEQYMWNMYEWISTITRHELTVLVLIFEWTFRIF